MADLEFIVENLPASATQHRLAATLLDLYEAAAS